MPQSIHTKFGVFYRCACKLDTLQFFRRKLFMSCLLWWHILLFIVLLSCVSFFNFLPVLRSSNRMGQSMLRVNCTRYQSNINYIQCASMCTCALWLSIYDLQCIEKIYYIYFLVPISCQLSIKTNVVSVLFFILRWWMKL